MNAYDLCAECRHRRDAHGVACMKVAYVYATDRKGRVELPCPCLAFVDTSVELTGERLWNGGD